MAIKRLLISRVMIFNNWLVRVAMNIDLLLLSVRRRSGICLSVGYLQPFGF